MFFCKGTRVKLSGSCRVNCFKISFWYIKVMPQFSGLQPYCFCDSALSTWIFPECELVEGA